MRSMSAVLLALCLACLPACKALKTLGSGGGPKPSADECDELFSHKAELIAGKGASAAAKQAAKVTFIKSDTTAQWCEGMSRTQYDCEMKATTQAADDACSN